MKDDGELSRRDVAHVHKGQRGQDGLLTLAPCYILVEPQMAENIGSVARAMLNCGLADLRLVRPRDGWPNAAAWPLASGAQAILEQARLFDTIEAATADCHTVLATAGRDYDVAKAVMTPRAGAAILQERLESGQKCAVLFGGERAGLSANDIAKADAIITVPLNPYFNSLNLAQAALLLGYEFYAISGKISGEKPATVPANREVFDNLFVQLEKKLDGNGFFTAVNARNHMIRSLRSIFLRAECSDQEIRMLQGVFTALYNPAKKG